jgi:hypothetical protein
MEVFQSQIMPMFLSIGYVSDGAEPVMPPPVPGDLSGLYWGWRTDWVMGIDMLMRMEMNYRTLIFWPDGYFYDGSPPDGLRPLDPKALMAAADDRFGVYEVRSGTLHLTYATGETDELSADGEAWQDGDRQMFRVDPLADGAAIDGTISSLFFSGFTPGIGMTGGVSASSSYTFRPDGTYVGDSGSSASAGFDGGGGFSTSSEDTYAGRYEIRDGLLVMMPADGSAPSARLIFDNGTDIMVGDSILE